MLCYTILQCNDANAIPTRMLYADTYAITIAVRYGWEGLGGQVCLYVE